MNSARAWFILVSGFLAAGPGSFAQDQIATGIQLPSECSFNPDAGNGNFLFIRVRLENGLEGLFMLDTGCPTTILDKSLELALGKSVVKEKVTYSWLGERTNSVYHEPKLYLGDTQLLTGDYIHTDNLSEISQPEGGPLIGILGMDCLAHYCLQIDFADHKIRFLEPSHPGGPPPGRAFAMRAEYGQYFLSENLVGVKGVWTAIDTGDADDGALDSKLFKQKVLDQDDILIRYWKSMSGVNRHEAIVPTGSFGDESYTNLILGDCAQSAEPEMNSIGLRFLGRHLVTLDFPAQIMYLKRRQAYTPEGWTDGDVVYHLVLAAQKFLTDLKHAGQVPGFLKEEHGHMNFNTPDVAIFKTNIYPQTFNFIATKTDTNDVFQYHYSVVRMTNDGPWKLEKAWRTDANQRTVQEYQIPEK